MARRRTPKPSETSPHLAQVRRDELRALKSTAPDAWATHPALEEELQRLEAEVPAAEVPAAEVPAAEVPAAEVPAAEVPAAEVDPIPQEEPAQEEPAPAPLAPAPDVKEEAPMPEQNEKFPKHPHQLSGEAKERVAIWARQEKANVVTLCRHKSSDGKLLCYYPASVVRDPSNDNNPMKKTDEMGREYTVGRCSYAGDEHPEIRIYPPKKEDDIL